MTPVKRRNTAPVLDHRGLAGPPAALPVVVVDRHGDAPAGLGRPRDVAGMVPRDGRRDGRIVTPYLWNDLLDPKYRGKVAMARPSRSGTTPMIAERLLQVHGWDDGWAYLLERAGNLSTLTARSFGVPEGSIDRRFDIGFAIDVLAQSRAEDLQFHYGRPVVLASAQIGILKQVQDPAMACTYALSARLWGCRRAAGVEFGRRGVEFKVISNG